MLLSMNQQSRFLRETTITDITMVRLESGVSQQMLLVNVSPGECFAAQLASVGSLVVVNPHVLLQRIRRSVGFVAFAARQPLTRLMDLLVLYQRLQSGQPLLAPVARVLSRIVSVTLVLLQGKHVPVRLVAQVTLDFRVLFHVEQMNVHVHVVLHLELLLAIVADKVRTIRVLSHHVLLQTALFPEFGFAQCTWEYRRFDLVESHVYHQLFLPVENHSAEYTSQLGFVFHGLWIQIAPYESHVNVCRLKIKLAYLYFPCFPLITLISVKERKSNETLLNRVFCYQQLFLLSRNLFTNED